MPSSKNIIGPTIQRLRFQKEWTQAILTARCNRVGWDIGENIIAKIEAQHRCVSDREIVFLVKALGVKFTDVFPPDAMKLARS